MDEALTNANGGGGVWTTQCCIAGGGPAGMMLGLLLARSGVDVVVLEKHGDFLRDFRGDTIHPSTLEVIHELGLLGELLARPHQEVQELRGQIGDTWITVADFRHLPAHCRFLAFMPQWEFLDFLAEQAKQYPSFRLVMNAGVVELLDRGADVEGVLAETPDGPLRVLAGLTIGADGRQSKVGALAGLTATDIGAPIDVLWMRMSRRESDPGFPFGRVDRGRVLAMIYRDEYWQIGFVIPKGDMVRIQEQGIESLRAEIADALPFLHDRTHELRSWEDVRLLSVKVDRMDVWYRSGLLCIGDAAHAMSPVGGVGINLAIQDAVASANVLARPLLEENVTVDHLRQIQRRRELPTRLTQRWQVFIQEHVLRPSLEQRELRAPAWLPRFLDRWPALRRIPARMVGIGFRPEHVAI